MHFDPSRFEYSIQTSNAVILFLNYNQQVKLFFKTLTGLAPVMHLQTAEISRQTHPLRFSAPFSDGSTFLALINLNPIFLTFTQFLKSMCPKVKNSQMRIPMRIRMKKPRVSTRGRGFLLYEWYSSLGLLMGDPLT